MTEALSPRLNLLLQQGIEGTDFWDICCDHGYLGEAALASGSFRRVYFVDQVAHIIQKLKARLDFPEASFFAQAAQDIEQNIEGVVILAGVGGFNLIKILQSWDERHILHAQRLVLNPLTHVVELRQFLDVWTNYREVETISIFEKSKSREILILEPS